MARSAAAAALLELIRSRKATTGVIGLGYVVRLTRKLFTLGQW